MNQQKLLFIGLFLTIFLAVRLGLYYQNVSNYRDGQKVDFEATINSQPYITNNAQHFSVDVPDGKGILITTSVYSDFRYGETVKVSGPVKILPRKSEGRFNGASTQDSIALKGKQTVMAMYFPKIESVKMQDSFGFQFVRTKLASIFQNNLPSDSSSLLLGIVFGFKHTMSKDFKDNLRIAGATHVIAASGMNVTMVAGFLSTFFLLFLRRKTALAASMIGILFYAAISGFEPSIVRASIMGILAFTGQILGRQTLAFYSLFLTGYGMLFVSPQLLQDVGFQLSFLSTLGLIFLPKFFENLPFMKVSFIGEDLRTSISAQLATFPILLSNFGSYSLLSIPANALVLWTVPILMVLGGIAATLGFIHPLLAQPFLYLSLPLLLYFEKVVSLFAWFGKGVSIGSVPVSLVIGYYCVLFAILRIFHIKKEK